MMTQTPISARIYNEILWAMEQEKMVSGNTRNAILNEGAKLLLDLLDTRRNFRAHNGQPVTQSKILAGFLYKWFPESMLKNPAEGR